LERKQLTLERGKNDNPKTTEEGFTASQRATTGKVKEAKKGT
jgi:hypothetical protein